MRSIMRQIGFGACLGLLTLAAGPAAQAQVGYAPPASPLDLFFSPYDESYDTHPSYQILPDAPGGPAVRVVHRCAYLGGWNVGDFSRDLNGTPLGVDHTCPEDLAPPRLRARY